MLDALYIIAVLARRTWADTFGRLHGWVICAGALLVNGVIFNVFVLGSQARYSEDVLRDGILQLAVTTCLLCPLWGMRAVAHEREQGTWVFWAQSRWSTPTLTLGKWIGACLPMLAWLVLSITLPAMIFLNGRVSWAHLAAGYVGLGLCAALMSALSVLTSALARAPWVAALMAYAIGAGLVGTSALARVTQGDSSQVLQSMGMLEAHIMPFARGQLATQSVAYFLVLTALCLGLSALRIERIRGVRP